MKRVALGLSAITLQIAGVCAGEIPKSVCYVKSQHIMYYITTFNEQNNCTVSGRVYENVATEVEQENIVLDAAKFYKEYGAEKIIQELNNHNGSFNITTKMLATFMIDLKTGYVIAGYELIDEHINSINRDYYRSKDVYGELYGEKIRLTSDNGDWDDYITPGYGSYNAFRRYAIKVSPQYVIAASVIDHEMTEAGKSGLINIRKERHKERIERFNKRQNITAQETKQAELSHKNQTLQTDKSMVFFQCRVKCDERKNTEIEDCKTKPYKCIDRTKYSIIDSDWNMCIKNCDSSAQILTQK